MDQEDCGAGGVTSRPSSESGSAGRHVPLAQMSAADRLSSGRLTPMMQQYLSVKAEYPRAIILFRMGDFFETFFEDAQECARLLDITLTARSKEKDPIPMAGVPHHAIDGYVARLIEAGRSVVLADQVEDPKKAKGLVRREVTRVLTPGTYVDSSADPRLTRAVAAVAMGPKGAWGLSALDLSTGDFRGTNGNGFDVLVDELARLEVRELLVSDVSDEWKDNLRADQPALVLTERSWTAREEKARLKKFVGAEEMRGLEVVLPKPALVAAGALLAFVEEGHLRGAPDLITAASLAHVRRLKPHEPTAALVLDASVRLHLELFRTQGEGKRQGSLLDCIDDAVTSMGGRLVARWLAYPLRDADAIAARHDAVEALLRHPGVIDSQRKLLARVADVERLAGRIALGRVHAKELAALRNSLSAAPDILAPLGGLGSASRLQQLSGSDLVADVRELLCTALSEEPSTDLTAGQVFNPGYDAELDRAIEVSSKGKAMLAELEQRERKRTKITSLKVRYNRVFGYFIDVTKANLHLVPDDYIRKQTTVNSERFFTEELKELESEVLSADERRVERTQHLFRELVAQVGSELVRLCALADALAEADALLGFARLAERRDWVRPELSDDLVIDIKEGRHPVIEGLASQLGEPFVPNDVVLGEQERLVIVTGPNMAGKSTVMRQTALIAILAHMGCFVPARSARIGLLDRVFTRVGASDDLTRGRSTFMVEMHETARILRAATERSLILLDEIGRGTSTFDGLSIAWAVAEYLHDVVGARTLFATHYHELTELCRDKERAVNRHVAVKEWNDEIVFLRKLVDGPTNRSYGVQVARLAGLPKEVVDRARDVLATLEAQALAAGDSSTVAHKSGEQKDQLFLFASRGEDAQKPSKLQERLQALEIDDITPRQALDLLAELQELSRKDD